MKRSCENCMKSKVCKCGSLVVEVVCTRCPNHVTVKSDGWCSDWEPKAETPEVAAPKMEYCCECRHRGGCLKPAHLCHLVMTNDYCKLCSICLFDKCCPVNKKSHFISHIGSRPLCGEYKPKKEEYPWEKDVKSAMDMLDNIEKTIKEQVAKITELHSQISIKDNIIQDIRMILRD